MTRMCYIYLIRCVPTKRNYVGSTVTPRLRWASHKKYLNRKIHGNRYIQRAWGKYGESQFEFKILEQCSEDLRVERETFWIGEKKSMVPNGFNMTGTIEAPCSQATRSMLGKTHSEASKKKMREARLGVVPWNKGIPHSEETRKKISSNSSHHTKNKGMKRTEESKQKMRVARAAYFARIKNAC